MHRDDYESVQVIGTARKSDDAEEVGGIIHIYKNGNIVWNWDEDDVDEFNDYGLRIFSAYQYLISKGYAAPLFFEPNHFANYKTAIELDLATIKI